MELTDLSLKVLALSTLLCRFQVDYEDTQESEELREFFSEYPIVGASGKTFVSVSGVVEALTDLGWADSDDDEEALKTLYDLLVDLDEKTPGVYIDLEE